MRSFIIYILNKISFIKSRSISWVRCVACMGEMRIAYKMFDGARKEEKLGHVGVDRRILLNVVKRYGMHSLGSM
jgi:hypothetical protein